MNQSTFPTGYCHLSGGDTAVQAIQPGRSKVAVGEVRGLFFNRTVYSYVPSGPLYAGRMSVSNATLTGEFELGTKVPEIHFEIYTLKGVLPLSQEGEGVVCSVDQRTCRKTS